MKLLQHFDSCYVWYIGSTVGLRYLAVNKCIKVNINSNKARIKVIQYEILWHDGKNVIVLDMGKWKCNFCVSLID